MRTIEESRAEYLDCENNCKHDKDCVFMLSNCPKQGSIVSIYHNYLNDIIKDIPLDRLEQICEAERDGRCVVLPCKVGDFLYHIYPVQGVIESRIRRIQKNINGVFIVDCKGAWMESKIGKTIFLTKAEAEQKLKETEGEDD